MKRLILEDKRAIIDDLLKRIAENLQLNDSRRKLVNQRYEAVSKYIEDSSGIFNNADIYAQGSYRIGTTVKPQNGEEYDLDFVVQIDKNWNMLSFNYVYNEFKNLMHANENWSTLVIEKTRCIRLNYADEFHMDIIPTCTANRYINQNEIMVPDKKEHSWVISNPEGYALWFESKYIAQTEIYLHDFYPGMEVRAAQPLPNDNPNILKQPIQNAVQLIKRFRDIYFTENEDNKPSSIILTTLIGQLYRGENSIYETLESIIQRFEYNLEYNKVERKQFHIYNPVLPKEIFTKEWDENPQKFNHFVEFMRVLKENWKKINTLEGPDLYKLLNECFGNSVLESALNSQGLFIQKMRDEGKTGILRTTGGAALYQKEKTQKDRENIFHGNS